MRVIHFATTSVMHKAFVLPLARYQRDQGLTVEFGCGEDLPAGYRSAVPELRTAGFTVHVVPFPYAVRPLADAAALLRLVRFFRRHRFDVVHTYTSKAGILVRTAARLAGRPLVVHTAYDFHFRKYASGMRRAFFMWIERTVSRFTDVLLCSADVIRDEAVEARIAPAGRMRVIGGPVSDLERFAVPAGEGEALRRELALAAGAPIVATVCRLVDYKGVDMALRVAAKVLRRVPGTRFVIMGGGPLEAELKSQAAALGIADAVLFTGFRPDDRDVIRLMSIATVFFLPTRREGYGISFTEAMAMGCPVVGPRMEPVASVVGPGSGILVTPEDEAGYEEALVRLLEDPGLRRMLGDEGRRRVHEELDPRHMYQAVTDLYRQGAAAA